MNLWEAWEPYRAARTALNNTLQSENVAAQAMKYIDKIPTLNKVVCTYAAVPGVCDACIKI